MFFFVLCFCVYQALEQVFSPSFVYGAMLWSPTLVLIKFSKKKYKEEMKENGKLLPTLHK